MAKRNPIDHDDEDLPRPIVEESLQEVAERAAMLGAWARAVAADPDHTVREVREMYGVSNVCGDIESLAERILDSLPVDALNCTVGLRRMRRTR